MIKGYTIDENHAFVKQTGIFERKQVYDVEYVRSRYDTYTTNEVMSMLRLDLIKDHCGRPEHIFDLGYGNGAFLKQCVTDGIRSYGFDVSGYPIPEGCVFASPEFLTFDVVTLFDVFEHLTEDEQRNLLATLQTRYLVISVPWCHAMEIGWDWFYAWRHRRVDEHLAHFGVASLCSLLKVYNYKPIFVGNPEDAIRKSDNGLPNILTVIFERV